MIPSSDPPSSSATMTTTGLTPTCRSMIFGTSRWFSICCCTSQKIATHNAARGETVSATRRAGTAESSGAITYG